MTGLEQKTRVWSISTRSQGAHMHCYGEPRSSLLDLNMCLILLSPCRLLSSGIFFFSIYNTETMATQHLPTSQSKIHLPVSQSQFWITGRGLDWSGAQSLDQSAMVKEHDHIEQNWLLGSQPLYLVATQGSWSSQEKEELRQPPKRYTINAHRW